MPRFTASSKCCSGDSAPNGFGAKYAYADELSEAFWGAIPLWRAWNASEATQFFLEWFRFGLFMAAWRERRGDYLGKTMQVVPHVMGRNSGLD